MRKSAVADMWARHESERTTADDALRFSKRVGNYTIHINTVEGTKPVVYVTPPADTGDATIELLEELLASLRAVDEWWSNDGDWPDDGHKGRDR